MYYRIPELELSLSVPLVLLLQAVFRRAGARGLIYDFLLLSCGIRLLMFQPCFDRILICLIRSLIFYTSEMICEMPDLLIVITGLWLIWFFKQISVLD